MFRLLATYPIKYFFRCLHYCIQSQLIYCAYRSVRYSIQNTQAISKILFQYSFSDLAQTQRKRDREAPTQNNYILQRIYVFMIKKRIKKKKRNEVEKIFEYFIEFMSLAC